MSWTRSVREPAEHSRLHRVGINPWCLLQLNASLNPRQARTWRNW
jgi:hypothetical protein